MCVSKLGLPNIYLKTFALIIKVMISEEIGDYLKTIYTLSSGKGYARIKDIASQLKIKPPSVSQMIRKLANLGYVEYERYGGVKLTQKGKNSAREIKRRHELLSRFFRYIGVPQKIADSDACRIEHYLHPKTVKQLVKFIEKKR